MGVPDRARIVMGVPDRARIVMGVPDRARIVMGVPDRARIVMGVPDRAPDRALGSCFPGSCSDLAEKNADYSIEAASPGRTGFKST